MMQYTVNTVCN